MKIVEILTAFIVGVIVGSFLTTNHPQKINKPVLPEITDNSEELISDLQNQIDLVAGQVEDNTQMIKLLKKNLINNINRR